MVTKVDDRNDSHRALQLSASELLTGNIANRRAFSEKFVGKFAQFGRNGCMARR